MSLYVAVLIMVRKHPSTWWSHAMKDARIAALESADVEYDDEWEEDEEGYRDHEWDEEDD